MPMMPLVPLMPSLKPLLKELYGVEAIEVQLLRVGDISVFLASREGGRDLIIRTVSDASEEYWVTSFLNMVSVLDFLHGTDIPAERILYSTAGKPHIAIEGWRVAVTEVMGKSFQDAAFRLTERPTVDEYRTLGSLLGQLHALPFSTSLPKATSLPEKDLVWARRSLLDLDDQLPNQYRNRYIQLLDEIESTNLLTSLPDVLIHHDCNLGNITRDEQGALSFIDWAGAGQGPAILDLAALLTTCVDHEFGPQYESIVAVMDGYRRLRSLTDAELSLLPDALRYRTLLLLSGNFPDLISGKISDEIEIYGLSYRQWWARYQRLNEISAIATTNFQLNQPTNGQSQ